MDTPAMNAESVPDRPAWDDYFLAICVAVAARADCKRRRHGAVIVKDHRIVATGYNGTPSGDPRSCFAGECPRAEMRERGEIPHLHADYSNCIDLHAEQNAIAYCGRADSLGATIYITGEPCDMCLKLIRAAGIERVVYPPAA